MHAFIDVGTDAVESTCSFWTDVTGWPVGSPWPEHPEFRSFEPTDGSAYLHVQRIGGPPRVHLDLMSHDVDVDRVAHVALGATAVKRYRWWQVMASPGGLPYCLVAERHERRRPPGGRMAIAAGSPRCASTSRQRSSTVRWRSGTRPPAGRRRVLTVPSTTA